MTFNPLEYVKKKIQMVNKYKGQPPCVFDKPGEIHKCEYVCNDSGLSNKNVIISYKELKFNKSILERFKSGKDNNKEEPISGSISDGILNSKNTKKEIAFNKCTGEEIINKDATNITPNKDNIETTISNNTKPDELKTNKDNKKSNQQNSINSTINESFQKNINFYDFNVESPSNFSKIKSIYNLKTTYNEDSNVNTTLNNITFNTIDSSNLNSIENSSFNVYTINDIEKQNFNINHKLKSPDTKNVKSHDAKEKLYTIKISQTTNLLKILQKKDTLNVQNKSVQTFTNRMIDPHSSKKINISILKNVQQMLSTSKKQSISSQTIKTSNTERMYSYTDLINKWSNNKNK